MNTGIGLWIAYPNKVDVSQLLTDCEQYNITWLAVKTGDLVRVPNNIKFFRSLLSKGIDIYTWNYSVPTDLAKQIDHISRNIEDGAAGHIVNAEIEWDNLATWSLAKTFVSELRSKLPGTFLSHAPFAYKNYHPNFAYGVFNSLGSVMPQMYWTAFDNMGSQWHHDKLSKVWKDCEVPMYPIGVSYDSSAGYDRMPGTLKADDVKSFFDNNFGCDLLSFYSYEASLKVSSFWSGLSSCHYHPIGNQTEIL